MEGIAGFVTMYKTTDATTKSTTELVIDATLMVIYALTFPVNLQRIADAMINAYLYNYNPDGVDPNASFQDNWTTVTYTSLFDFLELENTYDRDFGAFSYMWQIIAGANQMSILADIVMVFGSFYLKSWPALTFFVLPILPKILLQIGFWLSPVLW